MRLKAARKPARQELYVARVHHAQLAPGLDLSGFNRLADELENDAAIYSSDSDFARFKGVEWVNPLA